MFGAAHLEEGRTVDFKLRDLVKKSENDEAVEWQLQRLMEGNKWRNVQQIVMERMGGDPADNRVEALKTMALLAEERMPESGKAADFWRQVHQADKFDIDARHALLEVYEAAGKWKEFAAILKLEVDDIPEHDVVARLDGLRRLVAVTSAHLRQDAQVIAMYGDILALDPDDAEATEALCARYEKMRRWPTSSNFYVDRLMLRMERLVWTSWFGLGPSIWIRCAIKRRPSPRSKMSWPKTLSIVGL